MEGETPSGGADAGITNIRTAALGGLLGGLLGGFFVVGMTLVLKAVMEFFAAQNTWVLLGVPLLGLSLAVLLLQVIGRSDDGTPSSPGNDRRWARFWTFPRGAVRADITGDVVDYAGREERFPWRLAPLRALAILATVGSGAAMGTEAPAAYLGDRDRHVPR